MVALLLVALAVGLSNFSVAVGIGMVGVDAATRLRVGVIFGVFETGMPLLGLVIGRALARDLGHTARWASAGLLIATGCYTAVHAARHRRDPAPAAAAARRTSRLLVTGLAVSVDNLAIGFALGTYHVSVVLAAVIIGAVSVALSLVGLELGGRVGAKTGDRGELFGGVILVAVGAAIASGLL